MSHTSPFTRQDAPIDQTVKGAALLQYNCAEPVTVTQLKYSHIPKATQTWLDAFVDDPAIRYCQDTPDRKHKGTHGAIEVAIHRIIIALWIRTKITKTVDKGASFIIATYAKNSNENRYRSPSQRFFDLVLITLRKWSEKGQTPNQKERMDEYNKKSTAAAQNTIGDSVKDMLYVDGICTSPAYQGRGYGGAVLDSITAIADAQRRAIWLISGNINNTRFYNSHGFVTVGTFALGDKNPDWREAPVIVSIMVRKST